MQLDPGPTPVAGGASLFVRGDKGAEAVGEIDGRYASAGQSRPLSAATSPSNIRCLAAALTAPGYSATVASQGPDFGQGGIVTRRVVVNHKGGGLRVSGRRGRGYPSAAASPSRSVST